MSTWPSTRGKRVLAALVQIGWRIKRQSGSHRTLARDGRGDYVFAFHDDAEVGPAMLSRVAKHTGLTPGDLLPPLNKEVHLTSFATATLPRTSHVTSVSC